MTRARNTALTGILMALLATPVLAQQSQGGSMSGMSGMSDMKNMSPAQKDMMAAMDKMNKSMMEGMMDTDPGLAWMKSMAAHHQGAIDMSEAVLKYTKDEEVKKEARKTAQENEKDMKQLEAKLKKKD